MNATTFFTFALFSILSICIITGLAAAQPCTNPNTGADNPTNNGDCDGIVNASEIGDYIQRWYACSSCVPDIYNAMAEFFAVCGDNTCNFNEDCSSCQQDCGNCSSSTPAPTFPQDYISYWKFENNADDETGTSNGTEVGNITYVPGQVGQALESNEGGVDYINFGSNVGYEGASGITISFWVKHASGTSSNEDIISDYSGGADNVLDINYGANELISCRISYGQLTFYNADLDTLMKDTNWHHYVCIYNQTHAFMYFDGTMQALTPAAGGNLHTTTSVLRIGSGDSGGWNGLIDEVIIYDRALNDTEIQQIYNNQSGIIPTCTNATGCSAAGDFCDTITDIPYNCALNPTDGCLYRTDKTACTSTEMCQNGQCVPDTCSIISNCSDYLDPTNCSINNCTMNPGFGCAWNTGSNQCEDVPDPCAPFTQCSHYIIEANCTNNICGAGTTGCTWNTSTSICENTILPPNAIYVDERPGGDCIGSYSISGRSCGGTETSYETPQAAADASAPGDTIYFRAGHYYENTSTASRYPVMKIITSGTIHNPITYTNYNNEVVILDATHPANGYIKYRTIAPRI
jgi:hypothetical protein